MLEQQIQNFTNKIKMKEQILPDNYKIQNQNKFLISRSKSFGKLPHKNKQLLQQISNQPLDTAQKKNENNYIATLLQQNRNRFKSSLQSSVKCLYNNDCLNTDCNCGRHLSKINAIKPEMNRGNSTYMNSYYGKHVEYYDKIIAKDSDKLKGDHLDMKTIYGKEFKDRETKSVEKFKPKDALKFQGPASMLTTYSNLFPGHKGSNQYIRPTDNIVRADLPFNAKSTYESSFNSKQGSVNFKYKLHDNPKPGQGLNWLVSSTYRNVFQKPNPEYYPSIMKISQKLNDNPHDGLQFKTIYQNDFLQKNSAVCPAKLRIQKELELSKSLQKGQFQENTDFKAMSQEYHAISTSKVFKGW